MVVSFAMISVMLEDSVEALLIGAYDVDCSFVDELEADIDCPM